MRKWSSDGIRIAPFFGMSVVSPFQKDQVIYSNKQPKLSVAQNKGLSTLTHAATNMEVSEDAPQSTALCTGAIQFFFQ